MEELIHLDDAIKQLGTSRATLYRWLKTGKIVGIKAGRQWRFKQGEIDRFLKGEDRPAELSADISPLLSDLRSKVKELEGTVPEPAPHEDPVITAVTLMMSIAVSMESSDIHIESHWNQDSGSAHGIIRFRIDGVLLHPIIFDARLLAPIIERWKIMANCDVHEKTKPQDGRILVEIEKTRYDMRINFMTAVIGETLTARILYPDKVKSSVQKLGYPDDTKTALDQALQSMHGIVVFTGPYGSGTSTALYACLGTLTKPEYKIISVENPVELFMPGITQLQVIQGKGITFPYLLRSALRAAPNILSIGAVYDSETIAIAEQAALVGHLVLTVMQCPTAAGAVQRLVDMSDEPFIVADAVKLVIGQRLIRRLCPECKKQTDADSALTDSLKKAAPDCFNRMELNQIFEAVGCAHCHQTGYKGRLVATEALPINPAIQSLLRRDIDMDAIHEAAINGGMRPLALDAWRLANEGLTSQSEVRRVLGK